MLNKQDFFTHQILQSGLSISDAARTNATAASLGFIPTELQREIISNSSVGNFNSVSFLLTCLSIGKDGSCSPSLQNKDRTLGLPLAPAKEEIEFSAKNTYALLYKSLQKISKLML